MKSNLRRTNLQGQVFGKWTVEEFSHINSSRSAYWKCRCTCGNIYTVSALSLRKGESTQCRSCSSKQKTAIYNVGGTKKYIYVFQMGSYYKIGVSNEYLKRLKHIDRNSPYPVNYIYHGNNVVGLEQELHHHFNNSRIKGEWFSLTEEELLWIMNRIDKEIT